MEPTEAERQDEAREDRHDLALPTVVTDAAFDEAMETVLDERAAALRRLTT